MGVRDWFRRQMAGQVEQRAEFGGEHFIPPPGSEGSSYADISLGRAEQSLQAGAVWSAVNLLVRQACALPIDTFRRIGDEMPQLIPNPPVVEDTGGEGYGGDDWRAQYLFSMLLRGNVVGKLGVPDRRTGYPAQVVLYHPDEAFGWRDYQGVKRWRVEGKEVPAAEVWHKRAYPIPGAVMGMSPVRYGALGVAPTIAAGRYATQFFTDGGAAGGIVYRNEEKDITQQQAAAIKSRHRAATTGTREPVVIGRGWAKPDVISVSPADAQMLELLGWSAAECCRLYGAGIAETLGYETGGSLTYDTRVDKATDLLVYALDPWLVHLERVYTGLLPRGQFVKFNRSALLRMTATERWKVHEIQLRTQARVVNEVRADEDWGPVAWGDKPVPVAASGGKDTKKELP